MTQRANSKARPATPPADVPLADHLERPRKPAELGAAASDGHRRFWRTLAEEADEHALVDQVVREFPHLLPLADELPDRRQFLSLLGASLALAGVTGCEQRESEQIVPYVHQPEQIVPGRPLHYATATLLDGYARGVLVESHMGRPTKIEGNPLHPATLGSSDVFMQAECLSLYDPQRTQTVFYGREINTWDNLLTALRPALQRLAAQRGAGLRVLTGNVTSPTLIWQMGRLLQQYPEARWHCWQPLDPQSDHPAAELAWGQPADVIYRFDQADVVVSLDCDFFAPGPAGVRYSHDFMAARRRPGEQGVPRMNRLYAVESTLSLTGAFADHRLPLLPTDVTRFAIGLAQRLGVQLGPRAEAIGDQRMATDWLDAVAGDLTASRPPGTTLIVPGPALSPAVHALVYAMNERLGNVGRTLVPIAPVSAGTQQRCEPLGELVAEMQAGQIELLVIIDGNPVHTAPADLDFTAALEEVPLRIHMSQFYDETSARCDWHVPASHALESWSDARAYDGTVTILQPLIAPLYNSKTAHGLLAILSGHPERGPLEIVQEYWQQQWGEQFAARWARALHDGVVEGTAAEPLKVQLTANWAAALDEALPAPAGGMADDKLSLVLRADPTLWDGSYAHNAWLQELPKPFTKLTWDNAALVSPATARRLHLENEDLVLLSSGERRLEVPAWVTPGLPDDTITLYLGSGQRLGSDLEKASGFDAYRLRTADHLWSIPGIQLQPLGRKYPLACTQEHHLLEGRDIIRAGTLNQWREDPRHPEFMGHTHEPRETDSLFEGFAYEGNKWGMSIDVGSCIGCNACVIACQAENNIPVVGKQQVAMGREMHWIRVDTYYTGAPHQPRTYHQPLPCMHCEHAPCELVCPVAATVHSSDGINQMVYNRCVGTRYCSNNCPYKVRRFNFFDYTEPDIPVLAMLRNPDVTVRSLGVMEKCTYCTQRISAARIEAEKEGRPIREGEVVTACQQACPTSAIVFGDLNQRSLVRDLQHSPLDYGLLTELNTRPRTRYLAAVKNLNPALRDRLE